MYCFVSSRTLIWALQCTAALLLCVQLLYTKTHRVCCSHPHLMQAVCGARCVIIYYDEDTSLGYPKWQQLSMDRSVRSEHAGWLLHSVQLHLNRQTRLIGSQGKMRVACSCSSSGADQASDCKLLPRPLRRKHLGYAVYLRTFSAPFCLVRPEHRKYQTTAAGQGGRQSVPLAD